MAPKRRKVMDNNQGESSSDIPLETLVTDAVNIAIEKLLPNLVTRITQTVIQQLQQGQDAENIQQLPAPGPPPANIYIWLKRFRKLQPKSFSTAATPIEARNWISHIEKIFNVLGIDDVYKVSLATLKLEDDAHLWWEVEKRARGGDSYAATLSWADFRNLFYQRYFSEADVRAYRREYQAIRQMDDEPIADFEARFLRLLSVVGEAAGSHALQTERFRWAICERFRRLIVNIEGKNISEVVNAVKVIENAWKSGCGQYLDKC